MAPGNFQNINHSFIQIIAVYEQPSSTIMKLALVLLGLLITVSLGSSAPSREDLKKEILESLAKDNFRTESFWSSLKHYGKKALSAAKKGCALVHGASDAELAFRMSRAFPEAVSEDEFQEDVDWGKVVKAGCSMVH
ncbi:uncharacterized protein [Diadema setosum]|uniref:uncharacterized protein n=1 Tax=Diadema setosum TaxID=31175 RepID=UPI003B3B162B